MTEWLSAALVVLLTVACATPRPPELTSVTVVEWTSSVNQRTGDPIHFVRIEYRSRRDGAFVSERFESGEYTRLHKAFYACIDEDKALHELIPCGD
jgi:hypothetical protein